MNGQVTEYKGLPLILKGFDQDMSIHGNLLYFKYGLKNFIFGSHSFSGEKTINISNITSVQLKTSGLMGLGFIYVSVEGDIESVNNYKEAKASENALAYISPARNAVAKAMKAYILEYISGGRPDLENGQQDEFGRSKNSQESQWREADDNQRRPQERESYSPPSTNHGYSKPSVHVDPPHLNRRLP